MLLPCPLGKILLAIDFIIVSAAGIYYGTLDAALYALVSVYITERAMDSVLYGFNETRIAYVVTEHPIEVAQRVMDETDRGVTYLNGEGGFQRDKKLVIMCAMPRFSARQKACHYVRYAKPPVCQIQTHCS